MAVIFKQVFFLILFILLATTSGCTLTPHHAIAQNNLQYLESKTVAELDEGVFGDDWKPIHVAAKQGNLAALNLLIRKGVDLNALTFFGAPDSGLTPLQLAIVNNQTEAVKTLITAGASVDLKNAQGVTPLAIAVGIDNQELTKFLIDSNANLETPNINGVSPLMLAVQRNNLALVKLLVEAGADINSAKTGLNVSTPLIESTAIDSVSFEITEFLVQNGANVNLVSSKGDAALHFAVSQSNYAKVNFLIASGADLNLVSASGASALHIAAINRNKIIIESLLNHGANPNVLGLNQTTPIQEAAYASNNDSVKLLIKAGANVNHRNTKGLTALHFAAYKQYKDIADTLIAAGADSSILAEVNESIRKQQIEQEMARQRAQIEEQRQNNNLLVAALVGIMNVAANAAYPTTTYRPVTLPAIPVRQSVQPSTYPTLPFVNTTSTPRHQSGGTVVSIPSCNSDFECGMGKKCIKGPLQAQGQCLTPVNQYGLPQTNVMPDPNSIRINTKTYGACNFDTECSVGFRCDQTLKACVQ
jgi:ankyrin repeat protein